MISQTLMGSPIEDVVAQIHSNGGKVIPQSNGGYLVSCPNPAHGKGRGDRAPSLHVSEGRDARAVLYCHAGCSTDEVVSALGMTLSDLFVKDSPETSFRDYGLKPFTVAKPVPAPVVACDLPLCESTRKRQGLGECVAQYPYTDEHGTLAGSVHRYEPGDNGRPKSFRPFTAQEDGTLKLGGKISVPYGLPRVREVLGEGGTVLICEGEKDADRVNALGRKDLAGTTNSGGAGKWTDEHSAFLVGLGGVVQVVGDTDAVGQDHARKVIASLQAAGVESPVLSWPTAGKDLSEHLDTGRAIDDLAVQESPEDSPEAPAFPKLGRVLTLGQLDELPPIRNLVDGWLSAPSAAILVGGYALGKTAVTVSLACSVASGTPFLGHEVEQRRTLYVLGEGARGMPRRVRAWQETWQRELPEDQFSIMVRPRGSLRDPDTWRELLHYCHGEGIGFVVLDTLSALAPDADETKDAPAIIRGLNDLAEQIDGTALLVHHPGWSDQKRSRGGYQLQANVDEVLVLTAASEGSEHLAVKVDKRKDGEAGQTHYLRRVVVPLGHDENGDPVSSITVEHSRLSDAEVPIRERVLSYLAVCGQEGASRSDIASEIGVSGPSGGFRAALSGLVGEGLIRAEGATRSRVYFITSDEE
jgi:hypothetical protein